jgi:hypothetical protein
MGSITVSFGNEVRYSKKKINLLDEENKNHFVWMLLSSLKVALKGILIAAGPIQVCWILLGEETVRKIHSGPREGRKEGEAGFGR